MQEILRTRRLLLREMTEGDLPDLKAVLQDPEVMTAYEHSFSNRDVAEWLARQRERYRRDGFGLWAVVLRSTGEMVGQAGITWQDCEGQPVLEVGYLLKKRFWHQGYASEAAQACRDYAFRVLGAEKVSSIIKTDNAASIPGGPAATAWRPGEGICPPAITMGLCPIIFIQYGRMGLWIPHIASNS